MRALLDVNVLRQSQMQPHKRSVSSLDESVSTDDAGAYRVVARSFAEEIVSLPAVLTVAAPAEIDGASLTAANGKFSDNARLPIFASYAYEINRLKTYCGGSFRGIGGTFGAFVKCFPASAWRSWPPPQHAAPTELRMI